MSTVTVYDSQTGKPFTGTVQNITEHSFELVDRQGEVRRYSRDNLLKSYINHAQEFFRNMAEAERNRSHAEKMKAALERIASGAYHKETCVDIAQKALTTSKPFIDRD